MPQAAMHVCAGPGCRTAIPHGERWCPSCKWDAQDRDRARRGSARERGYTSRWERYRIAYLKKHPLCVECAAAGRTTVATVVDHIKAHKGDHRLFWDPSNHRAVCKPCHDRRIDEGDFGRPAPNASRVARSPAPPTPMAPVDHDPPAPPAPHGTQDGKTQ